MKFKRYLEKIQKKIKEVKPDIEENVVEEVKPKGKKILGFVDRKKDPHQYLKRYIKEENYRNWFNRNYSNYTIYEAVGLTASDYIEMKREIAPESEHTIEETQPKNEKKHADKTYKKPTYSQFRSSKPFKVGLIIFSLILFCSSLLINLDGEYAPIPPVFFPTSPSPTLLWS